MNKYSRAAPLIVAIMLVASVIGCVIFINVSDDNDEITTKVNSISKFGDLVLDITDEDMEKIDCQIGDKVLVTVNGKQYNATYVVDYSGIGCMDSFICEYNNFGNGHLVFGIFSGDIVKSSGCNVGDTVHMEKNGVDPNYSKLQKYMKGVNDNRSAFIDDEHFCNFRAVNSTGLKDDLIYRSVSPFKYGSERSVVTAELYEEYGINYIISMGDGVDKVDKCRELYGDSYYPVKLYDEGNVFIEVISTSLVLVPEDVRKTMQEITESEGKVAINCNLGKDRTGAIVAMLQSLAGSSLEEIRTEYMKSFVYLYGVEVGSEEYNALCHLMFDQLFYTLGNPEIVEQAGNVDWSVLDNYQFDMKELTLKFLKDSAGMSDVEIENLIQRISE